MDSIVTDVVQTIDIWLEDQQDEKLTLRGGTINKILNTRQRIQEILLQLQFEGELSSELECVGTLWIDFLDLLTDGQDISSTEKKKKLIQKVLLLLELDLISRHLAFNMITKVFL